MISTLCIALRTHNQQDYSKDSSIALLKEQLIELKELLRQSESSKLQLQARLVTSDGCQLPLWVFIHEYECVAMTSHYKN